MIRRRLMLAALLLVVAAPLAPAQEQPRDQPHVVTQVSVINALLQGVYDGPATIGDLHRHGDFGLGTVNGLDGELVGLDGRFYQVRSDGSVHELGDEVGVPYATVTAFRPNGRAELPAVDSFAALGEALDRRLASLNTVVAVRIHGSFPALRVRSVPRQQPPYRPLAEVVRDQAVFELTGVTGTLVGFRTPPFMQGIGVPGWHLHFLAEDGRSGGHVLELRAGPLVAELDYAERVVIDLPGDQAFHAAAGLGRDMSQELHQVEQSNDPAPAGADAGPAAANGRDRTR